MPQERPKDMVVLKGSLSTTAPKPASETTRLGPRPNNISPQQQSVEREREVSELRKEVFAHAIQKPVPRYP